MFNWQNFSKVKNCVIERVFDLKNVKQRVIDVNTANNKRTIMALNIFEKRIKFWEEKYGSLPYQVQRKIDKLVEHYDKTQQIEKVSKVFSIVIGTKLIREFKGKKYSVTVMSDGYEFNGIRYKSLSAIANEITGTRWNGKKFFGLLQAECSTHTAALSRRSSAKLNDVHVGLQAQSAETHRSGVA